MIFFFLIYNFLNFFVQQTRLPNSPIRGVGDSPTHRYGESATPRLTDAGSRGVYKRKNKSLRSLCLPVVAGISGPAKIFLSAVGYNA